MKQTPAGDYPRPPPLRATVAERECPGGADSSSPAARRLTQTLGVSPLLPSRSWPLIPIVFPSVGTPPGRSVGLSH
jgi:hypothetical protein